MKQKDLDKIKCASCNSTECGLVYIQDEHKYQCDNCINKTYNHYRLLLKSIG